MPERIIIDTDPGVDDALAIFMALGSPELEVEALTTVFGNVDVAQTTRNALIILEVAGRSDVPVYAGAAGPLTRPLTDTAGHVHGDNGLGDIELPIVTTEPGAEPAAAYLSRRLAASDGPTTLVTLGPLTNVALALRLNPDIVERLERIICMGGAVWVPGNATVTAESNIAKDPEAADVVFSSGIPVVLVPLDVTLHCLMLQASMRSVLDRAGAVGHFVEAITPTYFAWYRRRYGLDGFALHDPCTIAYLIQPSLFETERMAVAVETVGQFCAGRLVPDPMGRLERPATVDVCLREQAEGIVDLVVERIGNAGH